MFFLLIYTKFRVGLHNKLFLLHVGRSGEFTVENETYSVEPVDDTLSGRHRVYRASDSLQSAAECGMSPVVRRLC